MFRTCDTNTVQSLFIIICRPDKLKNLEKVNNPANMMELYETAKKIKSRGTKSLYVTPYVMKEIEACESKLPGIIDFTRNNFLMRVTTSEKLIETIVELEDKYLEKDILLNDSTRDPQSAVEIEYKDGLPSRADAHIIAENNVLYGYPFFTLNEKHLICMKSSDKPNKPQRSLAILKKNAELLASRQLHKVAKKNLKSLTSTTFKVKHMDKSKEDLVRAMMQEL